MPPDYAQKSAHGRVRSPAPAGREPDHHEIQTGGGTLQMLGRRMNGRSRNPPMSSSATIISTLMVPLAVVEECGTEVARVSAEPISEHSGGKQADLAI